MTPNETNPVPTESKCERCGGTGQETYDICSCGCGAEYQRRCTCHAPIPTPEVGEWEEPSDTMRVDRDEEIDVRQAKTIIRDAVGEFLWSRMYQVMGRVPFHNLIIGIQEALSSQSSAFQKKIGEAVDEATYGLREVVFSIAVDEERMHSLPINRPNESRGRLDAAKRILNAIDEYRRAADKTKKNL